MKRIALFLWGLALMLSLTATAGRKEARMTRVYLMGFASSFTDTVAYITDVQAVDSVYILPKGLLADRLLYTLQLEGYVTEQRGVQNATVATFFSTNPRKMAKKREKLMKKYQDSQLELVSLSKEEFCYKAEEYMDAVVTEYFEEESPVQATEAASEGKKGGDW